MPFFPNKFYGMSTYRKLTLKKKRKLTLYMKLFNRTFKKTVHVHTIYLHFHINN